VRTTVTERRAADVLSALGTTFAVFDSRTQDSGHVSYGVQDAHGRRWFVKTSGDASDSPGGATNAQRRAALRRSAAVSIAVPHPGLIPTEHLVEAPDAVLLVSAWFDGQLLRSPPERRHDAAEPVNRFRRLPADEIGAALDVVVDLHVLLAAVGWTSGDLYDGSLLYDFDVKSIKVIDFEAYRKGPYRNEVGRLPGSTRFMAPEEHTFGATVDETHTRVAHTYDWTELTDEKRMVRARATTSERLDDSIERLAAVAEGTATA